MSYVILTYCHCMNYTNPLIYIGGMWGGVENFNFQKARVR